MLHGRTVALLSEWEERFPVLEWRVGDLLLWPLLRIQLASDLLAAGRPRGTGAAGRGLGTRGQGLVRALRSLLPDSSRVPATPHDAVFLGRPANRLPLGGAWVERFADPIASHLQSRGRSLLHLEHRAPGADYRTPRERPSHVVTRAVQGRIALARLRPPRMPPLAGFAELLEQVRWEAPASPVSRGWLARRAGAILRVADWFDHLLDRIQPRLGFCTVYYSVPGAAFCLSARRRGMPVADLQHGVIRGNPAYDGWSRFPRGGYPTMPAWFWAWTEADAAPLRAWPEAARPAHRVIVGGQPELQLWQGDDARVGALRAALPGQPPAGLRVLVTLSWSSGFSALVRAVISAAPPSWRWWVRLHPLMDRRRAGIRSWCVWHAAGRAEVDLATDLPLALALEAVDVHLTHNSTVVEEAARAGRPSVVIDERALDVYAPELASGWAVFARAPGAVIAALEAQHRRRRALEPVTPPAVDDVARALDRLLAVAGCPATAPAASFPTAAPA
jgi:hypothetical protein